MKRIFHAHRGKFLVGAVLCALQMLATMKAQLLKGDVLNVALTGHLVDSVKPLVNLSAAVLAEIAFAHSYGVFRVRLTQDCTRSLRRLFFTSLLQRPFRMFLKISEGDLVAKYTNQVKQIETEYFGMFSALAEMVLKTIFVAATLFLLDPLLAFLAFLILLLPLLVPKIFERRVSEAAKEKLRAAEEHMRKITSWLRGFEVIKNYRIEEKISERFAESNQLLLGKAKTLEREKAIGIGVSFAVTLGAQAGIAVIAAILVYLRQMTPGDFFSAVSLVAILRIPLHWMSKLYQNIIATRPIRQSLISFIDEGGNDQSGTISLNKRNDIDIEFNGVRFQYDEAPLLRSVDLRFRARGKYLLTGESGCGKSTAMNLLLGYEKQQEGIIQINSILRADLKNAEEIFAIARQEATIFQDTLRNNLTLYEEYEDQALEEILRAVGLERFACNKGLETLLTENGGNLSGGEKKRLSLARALLRQTPVLILDEPLANIDPENVEQIENLLLGLEKQTVIVISHQFSPGKLAYFDRIYEFKGGKTYEKVLS